MLSSHNQFGVVANNCEVAVQPDGSMTMAIASAAKGTNISVTLKPLGNEQWEIGNGISTRTAYIPDIMPLEVLATIGWASYVGNQMFADKMLSKSSNYNASSGTTVEQIFSNPVILSNPTSNPPQTLCITHDLVCSNISFLGLNLISFTQNQTSVQQQVPCLGEINVNVEDCCKQHDVSIWCSQTENDLAAANLAVIACITAKVIAARQEAFWSIKWTWGTFLCKLTNSVVELFSDIVDVAGGVLLEILTALADLVGEALATVLGLLSLGQVPQSLLQSILGTSEAILSPDLWDYDGSHAQSCLCRGTVPTTQCSEQSLDANGNLPDGSPGINPCRDVCKEMGKAENCFNCGWICNDLGQPIWTEAPTGQSCCPGTGTDCGNTESTAPVPNCCVNCNYNCNQASDGSWFWSLDPSQTGANCCNSAPSYSVQAGSGIPATGAYCGCNYVWFCPDGGPCELAAGGAPGDPAEEEISLGIGEGTLYCGNPVPPQPPDCCP